MSDHANEATKAEVQTTKLNKLPVPGRDDTEFSAEEAAEAFEQGESTNPNSSGER